MLGKNSVHEIIKKMVTANIPELSPADLTFVTPPKREMGDFGIPCFQLSEKIGINPPSVARLIQERVTLLSPFKSVRAVGPYVNFYLDRLIFAKSIFQQIRENSSFGSSGEGEGKKIVFEHTSINPNASPHIGRARNALIGDCLARILRFQGYEVEVHYYVNDMGKQIALLVKECFNREEIEFEELLNTYVEANRKAEENKSYEESALELLKKFEDGDEQVVESFHRLTSICINGQNRILERLGIRYDFFDRESSFVDSCELDAVIKELNARQALFEDEYGRYVIDLHKLGFERKEGRYFVLRRANGSSLYGYRDIAYNIYKMQRSTGRNIVVLGEDHKLYYEQLKTILLALGKEPPEVIYYSYVLLAEGKMSTRKGTVVLLSDFLNEAISRAIEIIKDAPTSLSEDNQELVANQVGVGAVKFSILKIAPNKNVTFDWDSALSFVGNSAPYLQYTCARIMSICRKYGQDVPLISAADIEISEAEQDLILSLSSYGDAVSKSVEAFNPSIIANYCLELARQFNAFYHAYPVLKAEEEDLKIFRLNLSLSIYGVLSSGLNLLGIEVPEQM